MKRRRRQDGPLTVTGRDVERGIEFVTSDDVATRMRYAFGRLIPTAPPEGLPGDSAFWAQVNFAVSPLGCWVWVGERSDFGHGVYRRIGAHRWAYEWSNAPVRLGLVVRHRCDNAPCVRPDHLEIGTDEDNRRDMIERGRAPWQRPRRPKFKTNSDVMLYVVTNGIPALFAKARGIDPFLCVKWATDGDGMPPEVLAMFRREFPERAPQ